MVILLDECLNIGLKCAWQMVIFQQDAVLHGLVPALDLAPRRRVSRRAAHMLAPLLHPPLGEGVRDEPLPLSESNGGRCRSGTSRQPEAVMASSSVSLKSLAVMPVHNRQADPPRCKTHDTHKRIFAFYARARINHFDT